MNVEKFVEYIRNLIIGIVASVFVVMYTPEVMQMKTFLEKNILETLCLIGIGVLIYKEIISTGK